MASTPTRDLPEEFLAATRKSQETMIRAIKTWVETVRSVTPKLPSAYAPLADRLPKLPSVTVPFTDRLPKPEDVVASSYDFAEHLLAIQRKFAEDLLQATEPLIPANARRAWQDATKADAAAAAKKTVAAAKTAVTETAQAAGQAIADAAPKPAAPTAQVTPSAPRPRPRRRPSRPPPPRPRRPPPPRPPPRPPPPRPRRPRAKPRRQARAEACRQGRAEAPRQARAEGHPGRQRVQARRAQERPEAGHRPARAEEHRHQLTLSDRLRNKPSTSA